LAFDTRSEDVFRREPTALWRRGRSNASAVACAASNRCAAEATHGVTSVNRVAALFHSAKCADRCISIGVTRATNGVSTTSRSQRHAAFGCLCRVYAMRRDAVLSLHLVRVISTPQAGNHRPGVGFCPTNRSWSFTDACDRRGIANRSKPRTQQQSINNNNVEKRNERTRMMSVEPGGYDYRNECGHTSGAHVMWHVTTTMANLINQR
jgi:hypothetical protein